MTSLSTRFFGHPRLIHPTFFDIPKHSKAGDAAL